MTPVEHAKSSASRHGGRWEDYIQIHQWFDCTKQYTGDWTHRMLRHHAAGIEWCIDVFGHSIHVDGIGDIPTKVIAEQHLNEDCGFIPTVSDWTGILSEHPRDWMLRVQKKKSKALEVV